MTVNENVWGSSFTLLDSMNTRTGASDLTDDDYTNFPPFVRNNLSSIGVIGNPAPTYFENDSIYIAYLNEHGLGTPWNPGAQMDLTIAYCACINTDLTIYNTIVVGTGKDDSIISDDFNFIIPNQDKAIALQRTGGVVPICFKNGETYFRHKPNKSVYPMNGRPYLPLYNPSSSSKPTQKMYMWTPDGLIDDTSGYSTSSERAKVNNNAYCSYWRDFGIRTFFGVIKLIYFDGTYSSTDGTPQNVVQTPVSLHWYETQTDTWISEHPILGAFVDLYFRRNVDGTYTSTKPANMCFVAEISNGLELVNEDKWGDDVGAKVWQPTQSLRDACNSFFPLFGDEQLGARVDTAITGTVQIGTQLTTSGNNGVSQTGGCLVGYQAKSWLHSGQRYSGSSMVPYKTMWLEMEGTAENLELLRKSAAAYGLFFADDVYNLADSGRDTTRWTDSNMCLGVVDNNGFTDGTYTRGTNNTTANNWDWKTASQSPYDPSRPPPSPTMSYDSVTTFNDISNIATLTRRYALTKQNVEDLGSELWQISSDIINNIQNDEWYKYTADVMDTFLVTDPLSCIVSLQKYPMTIPEQSGPVMIKLGKAETSISANITKATAKTYYFAPVEIKPRFGNSFMDYEPYTHFELYVPFCGTTELDPRDILGRTLSVNLVVDFNTGTCVAYVLSDSLVIETINGSLAIDIPVTGVDSTTIASNITQGIINTRNARYTHQFGTLGKVASPSGIVSNIGNVWGSAQTILTSENNAKLSEYELTHQPAQPHVIGSASPVGSWAIDFKCRLLIYYPTGGIVDESKVADSSQPIAFDNEVFEQYQAQIGFATVDPVSALGETYAHTLVCAEKAILNNVTTPNGRPATEPELQLIRQALQEGVILP